MCAFVPSSNYPPKPLALKRVDVLTHPTLQTSKACTPSSSGRWFPLPLPPPPLRIAPDRPPGDPPLLPSLRPQAARPLDSSRSLPLHLATALGSKPPTRRSLKDQAFYPSMPSGRPRPPNGRCCRPARRARVDADDLPLASWSTQSARRSTPSTRPCNWGRRRSPAQVALLAAGGPTHAARSPPTQLFPLIPVVAVAPSTVLGSTPSTRPCAPLQLIYHLGARTMAFLCVPSESG